MAHHDRGVGMTDRDARLAWRIFNLNWIPIGAMGAVLLAAVVLTDFSLEPVAFGVTSAIALVLTLVAYSRRFAPSDQARQRLVFMSGAVAQIVQVTAIVGPLSYVALAAGWPLQDFTLAAFDRAMGFDSRSVILFVNDHPLLSNALSFGYGMIKWPLLAIPIVLASTGRFIRLQQFVMALTVAMAITILISVFAPAIGNYQSLGLTAAEVPNVNMIPFLHLQHDIPQVRNGSLRYLELFKLAGVVAFPSFHAVSAVLFAWAFAPVRGWGPVALVLNALMLASTPVLGGHYLIDVVGGIALAIASIAFAKWVSEYQGQRTAATAPAFAVAAE
jgi:membrane-associated phospholipid phosphatase